MSSLPVRILFATLLLAPSAWADLWNVDFGADVRGPGPVKVGFAATGITASDFWNFYSADNPDSSFKVNGFLTNLKNAAGATSGVGLTVNNGDGLWGYASSDLMAASYIYSLSPDGAVQTLVAVTNLPAGTYNFYLYGADSQFNLKVGATDYGTKVSLDSPIINPPPWIEGHQYVRFSNVLVGASQTALISLGAGQFYYQGIIGGDANRIGS